MKAKIPESGNGAVIVEHLLEMISTVEPATQRTTKQQVVARILQLGYVARAEVGVTASERRLARAIIPHLQGFSASGQLNSFARMRADGLVSDVRQRLEVMLEGVVAPQNLCERRVFTRLATLPTMNEAQAGFDD